MVLVEVVRAYVEFHIGYLLDNINDYKKSQLSLDYFF